MPKPIRRILTHRNNINSHGADVTSIPIGKIIRFVIDEAEDNWIDVSFNKDDSGITIRGLRPITVEPRVSNEIYVVPVKY